MHVSNEFPIGEITDILIGSYVNSWKLPEPKLILSVTGGARDFQIPYRMKKAFKEGLIKAAISTDAWIVTGGINHGVMQLVGEAVKEECPLYNSSENEQSISLLGICTKEKIAGAENFIGYDFKYKYKPDIKITDKVLLDPNHNNFILVENNELVGQYGQEIDFRLNLECFLSQEAFYEKIPLVLIVVNGGLTTLLTVKKSIDKNIPILILAVRNLNLF